MSGWEGHLAEYLVTPNYAYCVGLGHGTSGDVGSLYAAYASDGSDGWGLVYADDQGRKIEQNDGSSKSVQINETSTYNEAFSKDLRAEGPPKNGVWVGGFKYRVARKDVEEGDSPITWMICAAGQKKNMVALQGAKATLLVLVDEEQGQKAESALPHAIAFMQWLHSAESGL